MLDVETGQPLKIYSYLVYKPKNVIIPVEQFYAFKKDEKALEMIISKKELINMYKESVMTWKKKMIEEAYKEQGNPLFYVVISIAVIGAVLYFLNSQTLGALQSTFNKALETLSGVKELLKKVIAMQK